MQCLIPEVPFKLYGEHGMFNYLEKVLSEKGHAVLCVALGLGAFGLPRMGMQGIAIASVLGRVLMVVLLWLGVRFSAPLAPFRSAFSWPEWPLLHTVLRSGLPLALQYGLEASGFALVTFWMGLLGPETLAAHEIALNIASLAFQVPFALSTAAAMRVGHAVGRNDAPGIARAGWTAVRVGMISQKRHRLIVCHAAREIQRHILHNVFGQSHGDGLFQL